MNCSLQTRNKLVTFKINYYFSERKGVGRGWKTPSHCPSNCQQPNMSHEHGSGINFLEMKTTPHPLNRLATL